MRQPHSLHPTLPIHEGKYFPGWCGQSRKSVGHGNHAILVWVNRSFGHGRYAKLHWIDNCQNLSYAALDWFSQGPSLRN